MLKAIVAILFGCLNYLWNPIVSSTEGADYGRTLIAQSLVRSAVLAVVLFCALWLVGYLRDRRRQRRVAA